MDLLSLRLVKVVGAHPLILTAETEHDQNLNQGAFNHEPSALAIELYVMELDSILHSDTIFLQCFIYSHSTFHPVSLFCKPAQ